MGISSTQGAHQVAQKFSSSNCPSKSAAVTGLPATSARRKSGRRWPTSVSGVGTDAVPPGASGGSPVRCATK
jgi:hypothetical protein